MNISIEEYKRLIDRVHDHVQSGQGNNALAKMGLAGKIDKPKQARYSTTKPGRYAWRTWGKAPRSNSRWVEYRAMQSQRK